MNNEIFLILGEFLTNISKTLKKLVILLLRHLICVDQKNLVNINEYYESKYKKWLRIFVCVE